MIDNVDDSTSELLADQTLEERIITEGRKNYVKAARASEFDPSAGIAFFDYVLNPADGEYGFGDTHGVRRSIDRLAREIGAIKTKIGEAPYVDKDGDDTLVIEQLGVLRGAPVYYFEKYEHSSLSEIYLGTVSDSQSEEIISASQSIREERTNRQSRISGAVARLIGK